MWRQTLARIVLYLLSAEYSVVMCRLAGNLSDLTVAPSQYDILLCSETLVSDMDFFLHVGHEARLRLLPVAVFYLLVAQTKVLDPTQTVKLPEPS